MSLHLSSHISHGIIDNTSKGHVTGLIWLHGHSAPISLVLSGNCLRDIAGTSIQFKNTHPHPHSQPTLSNSLPHLFYGTVGDMTASKKIKIPALPQADHLLEEGLEIPHSWANCLYLEWFAPPFGRIVIQLSDAAIHLDPHSWRMSADQEDTQKIQNLHAMRQFVASISSNHSLPLSDSTPPNRSTSEWNSLLHQSERLSKIYHEVVEKYGNDPDADFKQAFVMGWDGLLETIAYERQEHSHEIDEWVHDHDNDPANPNLQPHPLSTQINDLTSRAIDVIHPYKNPLTPEYQLVLALSKAAIAVDRALNCPQFQKNQILAYLKRSLHWLNEALRPCSLLMEIEDDPDQLTALAHLRSSSLEIRDEVITLRRSLR